MSRRAYCNNSQELNKRGGIDVIFFGGYCGAYMILRAFAKPMPKSSEKSCLVPFRKETQKFLIGNSTQSKPLRMSEG
jgi:hypothetical protein